MEIDLKSMNSKELEKLLSDVKKTLASTQARDRKEARKAAQKAAAEWGFSLSDISDDEKPQVKPKKNKAKSSKPKAASKPQFANPSDASQTWTGKGRQPNWYRSEIGNGKSPDDMRI